MKHFLLAFFALFLCTADAEPRIISLAPALTELVFQLGQGKHLVGRSEVCNYPNEVRSLPFTGRFGDPELERTLELRPTHIIANDLLRPVIAEQFRKAGIKILIKQCRNLEDYCSWVEILGRELNCETLSKKELKRISDFKKQCTQWNKHCNTPKKILWVIWDSPLMVAGKGSLPDEVIRLAGGVNIAGNVPQEYFKASAEWVLANPPDVVLWTASSKRVPSCRHHFWKRLQAVKNGRVISHINPDLLQRPGPRLTYGIQALHNTLEMLYENK